MTADKLFSRQGRTGWLYSGASSSWDCVHNQANQNPNTDAGGAYEALSLTEELLAIDG